jgi:hypothetical protein
VIPNTYLKDKKKIHILRAIYNLGNNEQKENITYPVKFYSGKLYAPDGILQKKEGLSHGDLALRAVDEGRVVVMVCDESL